MQFSAGPLTPEWMFGGILKLDASLWSSCLSLFVGWYLGLTIVKSSCSTLAGGGWASSDRG